MKPGVVEVFAYQETLLMMAVFGIAILGMIWAAFRRWLRHKESIERLIAEQMVERVAQNDARMERVEARLEAVEQGGTQLPAQIDALPERPLPDPILKSDEA